MMNHNNFNTIDPSQIHIPDTAVIQKVLSDGDKQATEQHDKAVRAFFVADGIASGIGKDLAFVDKIPGFIKEIIDDKLWECLYVAKGVVTPYYCRYIKGTDSENFRAFITARRPNGLETSVETIDRVLQGDPEVQRKFRAIMCESRQGERTDLIDETSGYDSPKLLDERHQKRIRAANRAAEAIPEVAELLDRGLIAIDIAAQLGRDIKDSENLTAEEREYVDKRDLIGFRLRQYIYTNPIPEDEDREPAYGRELNNYVKDLLGIKDRSKSVRMDNPKKAAEKLLQFYKGDRLQELITHLRQGLNTNADSQSPARDQSHDQHSQHSERSLSSDFLPSTDIGNTNAWQTHKNQSDDEELKVADKQAEIIDEKLVKSGVIATPFSQLQSNSVFDAKANIPLLKPASIENNTLEPADTYKVTKRETTELKTSDPNMGLTSDELAERLQVKLDTLRSIFNRNPDKFPKWAKKHDPDGWAWQRSDMKKGRCWLFIPINESS
ncbi:MAG: hypothetical protein SAK29_07205 [Scytonema sp. PMC 1069.18]|nr:hypothetical protein [Scytonema sp. PMC 1069.18]MEC4883078.1 hypothetical protein [Scytonema sp. PMC 1070.18]